MKTRYYILLIVLCFIGGALLFAFSYQREIDNTSLKYKTCSDFKTQEEAQAAYKKGAWQLDGYGKDGFKNGLACEDLLLNPNEHGK